MTEPLYVDNTILSSVAKCSTLAVTRHVLGFALRTESARLRSGSAAHAAWATYFRGGSVADAMDVLANGAICPTCSGTGIYGDGPSCLRCEGAGRFEPYEAWAAEHVPTDDRLAYANVERIMARWFETHPRAQLPFRIAPEHVEVYFAAPLDDTGEVMYCGIMDGFAEFQDGVWNVENKTTGRLNAQWLRTQRLSAQISGYHFLGAAYLGRPLSGTFLNVQEFSKLPSDPTRRCKEHGVPYSECGTLHAKSEIAMVTRTPYALDQWQKTALHLARKYRDLLRYTELGQIHKVRQQGMVNYSCMYCDLNEWCYLERSAGYAAANFVHDPWEPEKRALARVSAGEA